MCFVVITDFRIVILPMAFVHPYLHVDAPHLLLLLLFSFTSSVALLHTYLYCCLAFIARALRWVGRVGPRHALSSKLLECCELLQTLVGIVVFVVVIDM